MKETLDAALGLHILEVEVTSRCNLNCKHCYNRNQPKSDLPLEELMNLYRFSKEEGVWRFIVTGGEPTLYPFLKDFVKRVQKDQTSSQLILQSNGTLITKEDASWLKFFDLLHLSYDPTSKVREEGGGNLALAQKLIKKGVDTYLFGTIHKKNLHLIDDMVENANEANVPIGFNICLPTEGMSDSFLLSQKEIFFIGKKMFELSQEEKILRYTSPLCSVFDPNKATEEYEGIKGGCMAGVASCVVSAQGEVYPCPFFRLEAGNIYRDSLKDIWLKSSLFQSLRNRESFEGCGDCEYLSYCGGCRYRAYRKSGSVKGWDPLCYRNKAKGVESL